MRWNNQTMGLAVLLGVLACGCSTRAYSGWRRPASEEAVVSGQGFFAYGTRIDFVDDRKLVPPQCAVFILPGDHLLGVHLTDINGDRHAGEVPFRAEAGRHYVAHVSGKRHGGSGVPYDVWVEDSQTGQRLPEIALTEPAPVETSPPQPIP
jgi:hypothetical protein